MTTEPTAFDLDQFLPYLLNQAAEATSHGFQAVYRDRYGFTRTQWRVLANLGKFGAMSARDICAISHIEKTKVSRAVSALEAAAMLSRSPSATDRRTEILSLTEKGQDVFAKLGALALQFDATLRQRLGPGQADILSDLLRRLVEFPPGGAGADD